MPALPHGEGLGPIHNAGKTQRREAERTWEHMRLEKWVRDRWALVPLHDASHISKSYSQAGHLADFIHEQTKVQRTLALKK